MNASYPYGLKTATEYYEQKETARRHTTAIAIGVAVAVQTQLLCVWNPKV